MAVGASRGGLVRLSRVTNATGSVLGGKTGGCRLRFQLRRARKAPRLSREVPQGPKEESDRWRLGSGGRSGDLRSRGRMGWSAHGVYWLLGEFDFAVEDEVGGAGEGDLGEGLVAVGLITDFEGFAAGDVDLHGGGGAVEELVEDGRGDHTGAAGEGLAFHATFVGADGDVIIGEDLHEVGVGAVRLEVIVVADGGTDFHDIDCGEVIDKGDGMGDAGVEGMDGGCEALGGDRSVELQIDGVGHGDADEVAFEFGGEGAGDGFEGDAFLWGVEEALGVAAEAAGSIATHLGFSAVGVVVAKFEISTILGRLGGEESVCPDSAVAVTDRGDLLLAEGNGEVAVVDHHEVVSGSVHFGEGQAHGLGESVNPDLRGVNDGGRGEGSVGFQPAGFGGRFCR